MRLRPVSGYIACLRKIDRGGAFPASSPLRGVPLHRLAGGKAGCGTGARVTLTEGCHPHRFNTMRKQLHPMGDGANVVCGVRFNPSTILRMIPLPFREETLCPPMTIRSRNVVT